MTAVGDKYGRWTVISFAGYHYIPSGKRFKKWTCRCDCGNEGHIFQNALRSGASTSCGCYQAEAVPCKRLAARGLRKGCDRSHPNYNTWSMMIQRCYEEQHDSYTDYGGRGISVCDRWLEPNGQGFLNFNEDMGNKPKGFMLDRVDNTGNYTIENCRWATPTEQVLNRGINRNNTSGKTGVTWCKASKRWKAQITSNYKSIILGYSCDLAAAIEMRKQGELDYFGRYSNT